MKYLILFLVFISTLSTSAFADYYYCSDNGGSVLLRNLNDSLKITMSENEALNEIMKGVNHEYFKKNGYFLSLIHI